ncbi:MAG TPA: hypothetical protein PLZ36_09180 [Armatimonadota bacterium]|nr:hypothetical protein [Armatimonadota bacterium]HOS42786.1 hypothetical protein [Armatimonadota bacterium]
MLLDLAPGALVRVDGYPYAVEEAWSFFETEMRLDLLRLVGPSPAHERWLAAWQDDAYLMLLQRLHADWLSPPAATVAHDGEIFVSLARGSAFRTRRTRQARAKAKDGRFEFALFRANSGRVLLTVAHNEELQAWIGETLPMGAIALPE